MVMVMVSNNRPVSKSLMTNLKEREELRLKLQMMRLLDIESQQWQIEI
jgi:hypothetical protein